jgi:hypothetical protein
VETSLPPLKKLDDAWLTPNNNNDQWDQPIQKEEPTTSFEDEIAVDFNSLSIQEQEQPKEKPVVEEQEKPIAEKTQVF